MAQSAIAGREKPDMAKLEVASKAAESALKEVSNALEAAKHLRLNNERCWKICARDANRWRMRARQQTPRSTFRT